MQGQNAPETKQERTLDSQLRQMEKSLSVFHDGLARLEQFRSRLTSPRPESIEKGQDQPVAPTSFEGRLFDLNRTAQQL
ncbi:MAG: hypothetical protein ACRD2L_25365, partial [Terriglobia bacterium]